MLQHPLRLAAIVLGSSLVLGLLWYVGAWEALWHQGDDFLCRRNVECARLAALEQEILLFRLETGKLPRDTHELLSSDVPQWDGPYAKPEHLLDSRGKPILYLRSVDPDVLFSLAIRRPEDQSGDGHRADDIVREVRR